MAKEKAPVLTEDYYRRVWKDRPDFLESKDGRLRMLLAECSEEFLHHLFDFPNKLRDKADEAVLTSAEMVLRERYEEFDGSGFPKTVKIWSADGQLFFEEKRDANGRLVDNKD